MPSPGKLFGRRGSRGSNFFSRHSNSESAFAALKRAASGAAALPTRHRYAIPEEPAPVQVLTPPSTPQASHAALPERTRARRAPARAPATRRSTANASSWTGLSISPDEPDPDPFEDPLEPAVEIDEKADAVFGIRVLTQIEEEPLDPNAGPLCDICHEYTGIPRTDEGPDVGKIENVAMLPCGHIFGHICLLQWLDMGESQSCPTCRGMATHEECGHMALPALAADAPPLPKNGVELQPMCRTCRTTSDPGNYLLKYEWQMKQARGLAVVSMTQVPMEWAESRIQMEWQRMGDMAAKGPWDEELERSWLDSQMGRREW